MDDVVVVDDAVLDAVCRRTPDPAGGVRLVGLRRSRWVDKKLLADTIMNVVIQGHNNDTYHDTHLLVFGRSSASATQISFRENRHFGVGACSSLR